MQNNNDYDPRLEKLRLETKYERVDIRRQKEYGKQVHIRCYIPEIHCVHGPHMGFHAPSFLNRKLTELLPNAKLNTTTYRRWQIALHAGIEATRPSLIAEDHEVRALLPSDEHIKEAIQKALDVTYDEMDKIEQQHQMLKETAELLAWFTAALQSKAKKNMRFDQRLKALRAEFHAEVEALLADNALEEAVKAMENENPEDRPPYCNGAIKEFMRLAEDHIKDHISSGTPFAPRLHADHMKWVINKVVE